MVIITIIMRIYLITEMMTLMKAKTEIFIIIFTQFPLYHYKILFTITIVLNTT